MLNLVPVKLFWVIFVTTGHSNEPGAHWIIVSNVEFLIRAHETMINIHYSKPLSERKIAHLLF